MKVYIIRHGETYWNAEYRLQGRAGSDLNEDGIRLAELTAESMRDIPFDLCFTSPSIRARHTAEILLSGRNVEIREDPRLYELGFGVWEGKSLHPDHPDLPERPLFLSRDKDVFSYKPPEGGESLQDLIRRCGDFYQELIHDAALQDKTILVSTHGASSRALLYHVFEDKTDFWRGHVPQNCAVSILDIRNGEAKLEAFDRIYYPDAFKKHYY